MRIHQVTRATDDIGVGIQKNQMPRLLVPAHAKASLAIERLVANRAIFVVQATAEALQRIQTSPVNRLVNGENVKRPIMIGELGREDLKLVMTGH
jgi:hypothetical protein